MEKSLGTGMFHLRKAGNHRPDLSMKRRGERKGKGAEGRGCSCFGRQALSPPHCGWESKVPALLTGLSHSPMGSGEGGRTS